MIFMKSFQKTLRDVRWVPLEGIWNGAEDDLVFSGCEFESAGVEKTSASPESAPASIPAAKLVDVGTVVFGQQFQEGRIKIQVEFEEADYRSVGGIILQYSPETRNMLVFTVTGGGLKFEPGIAGYLFKLQSWGPKPDQIRQQQSASSDRPKVWTPLFQTGVGSNIMSGRAYEIEAVVRGAVITLLVDGVEIGKHNLAAPSLHPLPCGIFCLSHSNVKFTDFSIEVTPPKAFVVMQFQTPEYEALFRDVIEPVCRAEGLYAYRADFTYMPGLIIEDIKKQISEARVIIAEITPQNPNVYYEVGYADALEKPVILISDRKEGLKPFDVRAYRTIFYDNSIGGKNQIETDLQVYLRRIMESCRAFR